MAISIVVFGYPISESDDGLVARNTSGVQTGFVRYYDATEHGSVLGRRASDGHIFAWGNNGIVLEHDASLAFVQTFGVASSSAPGTLFPTNAGWNQQTIQFVNGFCYMTWFLAGTTNTVAVQKRNATTLALVTQWIFDNPGTGANPKIQGVSPDGTTAYVVSSGGPSGQDNKLYARDLVGVSSSLFVTQGVWVPSTGSAIQFIAVRSNGDVLVLSLNFTAGSNNGGNTLALYSNAGVQQWSVTPGIRYGGAMAISPDDTTAWLTSAYSGERLRAFSMTNGAQTADVANDVDLDSTGTGFTGMVIADDSGGSGGGSSSGGAMALSGMSGANPLVTKLL